MILLVFFLTGIITTALCSSFATWGDTRANSEKFTPKDRFRTQSGVFGVFLLLAILTWFFHTQPGLESVRELDVVDCHHSP